MIIALPFAWRINDASSSNNRNDMAGNCATILRLRPSCSPHRLDCCECATLSALPMPRRPIKASHPRRTALQSCPCPLAVRPCYGRHGTTRRKAPTKTIPHCPCAEWSGARPWPLSPRRALNTIGKAGAPIAAPPSHGATWPSHTGACISPPRRFGSRSWCARLVPAVGLEPTALRLQIDCSTTELCRR